MARIYWWNFWLGEFWIKWVTPTILFNAAGSMVAMAIFRTNFMALYFTISVAIFLLNIFFVIFLAWWNER